MRSDVQRVAGAPEQIPLNGEFDVLDPLAALDVRKRCGVKNRHPSIALGQHMAFGGRQRPRWRVVDGQNNDVQDTRHKPAIGTELQLHFAIEVRVGGEDELTVTGRMHRVTISARQDSVRQHNRSIALNGRRHEVAIDRLAKGEGIGAADRPT